MCQITFETKKYEKSQEKKKGSSGSQVARKDGKDPFPVSRLSPVYSGLYTVEAFHRPEFSFFLHIPFGNPLVRWLARAY